MRRSSRLLIALCLIFLSLSVVQAQSNGTSIPNTSGLPTFGPPADQPGDDQPVTVTVGQMRRANWYYQAYIATLKAEKDQTDYAKKLEIKVNWLTAANGVQLLVNVGEAILIAVHWK